MLLDEPGLSREAEAVAERMAESIHTDNQLDVLTGAAGFLLALVSLHRLTGSSRALDLARRCGDRLIETARPAGPGVGWTVPGVGGQPLAGFSHGAAGIALSLLKLAELTAERSYHETAVAAIRYERSLFDAAAGSWRDLRDAPGIGRRLSSTPGVTALLESVWRGWPG